MVPIRCPVSWASTSAARKRQSTASRTDGIDRPDSRILACPCQRPILEGTSVRQGAGIPTGFGRYAAIALHHLSSDHAGTDAIHARRSISMNGTRGGKPLVNWQDAGPALTVVAGADVGLLGVAWTLGRLFRPWMRTEAQAAADKVSAEVKALASKLATNGFPHIEAKLDSVEAQLGQRLDRMEARTEKVEARLLEAIRGRREGPTHREASPT